MTDNLGSGVSRILQAALTQYAGTIWQQGRPPCDSELNLMQSLALEATQNTVLRGMPSGFLGNETNPQQDYLTHPTWSNYFRFGPQRPGELAPIMWANVNGWLIPVAGTHTGAPPGSPNNVDHSNVITLDPPPSASGDSRVDFVFLEVWKARIQPNPSATNKPSASGIYRYGNVETGFSYLADDLIDPAIGFETNQRIQIQYRIRVVKGLVGLTSNPDGFDAVVVKAQGAAAAPTSYTFTNMRQALGDPGLWRAGDETQNALGTVDGYTYAIPIAVVFRRNGAAWNGNPSQNLNGGFNRNPTAEDRTGFKTFSTAPTLAANVGASATSLPLVSVIDLPLPASPATPVLIQVGDELMTYSGFVNNNLIVARGDNANVDTEAEPHSAGAGIRVVSGRPDGLFADQIASSDILDLRHLVNPNGFDYGALLRSNLDKLLRGQLRANWKLSGAAPRGSYVHYQDVLSSSSSVSLGVTKLDSPDNVRMVFSDAATIQPVELVCRPLASGSANTAGSSIGLIWSLQLQVNTTLQGAVDKFSVGDKIVIPVGQLKAGLQAGASDQVRWLNDSVTDAVRLRLEGETADLPASMFTVTPSVPTPDDDLTITFISPFPGTSATRPLLHIRAHIVYGPGRGLARRPDALHSISYISPSADLLTQRWGVPRSNKGAHVSWAPLWSKYPRLNTLLPVTAEMYADLGSKTVIVAPFRKIDFPDLLTMDGRAINNACPYSSGVPIPKTGAPTTGALAVSGIAINVTSAANVAIGDALSISSGPGQGRYVVVSVDTVSVQKTITVERSICALAGSSLSFGVYVAQGCMPLKSPSGASKWTQTDPLALFCGTRDSSSGPANAAFESIYVSLPRHLVPSWGELAVPLLSKATDYFAPGINYMVRTTVGAAPPDAQKNYAAYHNGGGATKEFSVFSQITATSTPLSLPYNTASTTGAIPVAGIRFFTDTRGKGRQGLEFPPFYGLARIMGVYQASDYFSKISPFTDKRETNAAGTAVNLLRQSMGPQDGPTLWIESDSDGDSTFILNANAIDISKAPTAIANFLAGTYVVEAVVFGFDRGSFDLSSDFRLILTRPFTNDGGSKNPNAWKTVGGIDVSTTTRAPNIQKTVAGLAGLLPGPATQSDQIVVNYSRTVYQGDAWGSQTSNVDLGYAAGPLLSQTAFQIAHAQLDQSALSRPSEKVLEVLAATSFSANLGTGRYSADASSSALDFRNVAFEDSTMAYPPAASGDARPRSLPNSFVSSDATTVGPEYLGCTERLPLGALFRDKDFRGQAFGSVLAPLVYLDSVGSGPAVGSFVGGGLEQQEIPIGPATAAMGVPGDLLVHVDGEQANYAQLTNFRVTRGGSVFTASGPRPGGIMSLQTQPVLPKSTRTNVLHGRAMLVRNTVTNVGASEVSAGDELMLLIVTTAQRAPSSAAPAVITLGTNGAGEGYSAADLYRIEGHPLVRNNIHLQIDPSSIVLSRG